MRIFATYLAALCFGVGGTTVADRLLPGAGWAFVAGALFGGCYACGLLLAEARRR